MSRRSVRRRLLDLLLAARVALAIATVRAALGLLPYRLVERLMSRARVSPRFNPHEVARVLRVVPAVGRRILPEKPCLTQALVARRMLRRHGLDTDLRIGVARSEGEQLRAHAWLERDGRVLVGGVDSLGEYTPLEPLAGT